MIGDETLSIKEVVSVCSSAKLANGTLCFHSYGSNVTRNETQEFLDANGLTLEDGEEIINSIKVEDLYKGPIDHYLKERKHKLWIFKKKYNCYLLYIKLLIYKKKTSVAVISLHEFGR